MKPPPLELEEIRTSNPVKLDKFVDHVEQMHGDSNVAFSDEYKVRTRSPPSRTSGPSWTDLPLGENWIPDGPEVWTGYLLQEN